MEDVRHQDSSGATVVTFKTRSEAENVGHMTPITGPAWVSSALMPPAGAVFQAANQGAKFKGRLLHLSWYNSKAKTSTVTPQDQQVEPQDQDQVGCVLNTRGPRLPILVPLQWDIMGYCDICDSEAATDQDQF